MSSPVEAAAANLEIRFAFRRYGRSFYRVLKGGRQLFLGLRGECDRFVRIHVEKVVREVLRITPPRDRRCRIRSFRVLRRRAASA